MFPTYNLFLISKYIFCQTLNVWYIYQRLAEVKGGKKDHTLPCLSIGSISRVQNYSQQKSSIHSFYHSESQNMSETKHVCSYRVYVISPTPKKWEVLLTPKKKRCGNISQASSRSKSSLRSSGYSSLSRARHKPTVL